METSWQGDGKGMSEDIQETVPELNMRQSLGGSSILFYTEKNKLEKFKWLFSVLHANMPSDYRLYHSNQGTSESERGW